MARKEIERLSPMLGARLSRRRVLGGLAGGAAMLATAPTARVGAQAGPQVGTCSAAANPRNVLSTVVTADGLAGTTARVEFGSDGKFGERTPEFALADVGGQLPVLALRPDTDYTLRVVATGDGGKTAVGQPLTFRTGTLPATVPAFDVRSPGKPEPGFTLLAPIPTISNWFAPSSVVILDETGRVVWYRETVGGVLDFQLQPNGHYTGAVAQPGPMPGVAAAVIEEWDPLGNAVATWSVQGFKFTGWHEFRLVGDGQEGMLLGFVSQTRDTQPFGGPPQAVVWGNIVQRLTRAGEVLFEWNTFDHFKLGEADDLLVWKAPPTTPGVYDWTHANAIEIDHDGNYLVSFRHFSEVTKIDAKTGAVIWRMGGGKGNQFKFIDDPLNGFSAQHFPRRLQNGHILLWDNGNEHQPPQSRAVEYEVDEKAKTARLVWSYPTHTFSFATGSAERLPNGNTLIAPGNDARAIEVTPTGEIVWEARLVQRGWGAAAWRQGAPGDGDGLFGIYRAFRVPSLYGVSE